MGVRTIAVTITGDGADLRRELDQAAGRVEQFARKTSGHGKTIQGSWKMVGAAMLGVAAVAASALTSAGVAAAQFEQRMRNVNSITKMSEAGLRDLSAATLDLSTRLPQDANTLAEGLYDIASSGFQGAEGLRVLDAAAKAASAGLSTTATSARAITAVLNAYGLSAASATDVSDVLFQTVNLGVISFDDLANQLGDFVGAAAAAKVPIDDAAAAIAAMTLAGVPAAEAATSLNQLFAKLVQPSEALANLYEQLGYESGATALQTRGLAGVMEDLRVATGGELTTLLQLFPEVRAARGALALMANEGKNYQEVSAGISDENVRQGATQAALKEQMKATSAEWKIWLNQAKAAAITLGTTLLPSFVDFLQMTRELGGDALPLLETGFTALQPLLDALWRTGVNVVQVLLHLADAAAPIAGALAGIAGATVLPALTLLATALERLTRFASEHHGIVLLLAAAYITTLVPSVAQLQIMFNRFILTPIVMSFVRITQGAERAAVGMKALAVSAATAEAALTFGLSAAILGAFESMNKLSNDQKKAAATARDYAESINTLSPTDTAVGLTELNQRLTENAAVMHQAGNAWRVTGDYFLDFVGGDGHFYKATIAAEGAAQGMDVLRERVKNTHDNLVELAYATGVSVDELSRLAEAQDIDLSKPIKDSAPARQQLIDYLGDLRKQTGLSGAALVNAAGGGVEAMEALKDAIAEIGKETEQAFSKATDVVSGWDPAAGLKDATKSTKSLTAAQKALADLRERQDAKERDRAAKGKTSGPTVSEQQQLRKAEERVAEARTSATKASTEAAGNTLTAYYSKTIRQADTFERDIRSAVIAGLDPQLVARLLEAGPEQAGPILQEILSDHSGRLIKIVNESEEKLREINRQVVENARLVALAVASPTDQMGKDLANAMRISQGIAARGGRATAEALAKNLRLPKSEIERIAQEFGITLANAVKHAVRKQPVMVKLRGQVGVSYTKGGDVAVATGGLVTGPGTGTSDSIHARLSNYEFVESARAVHHYGPGLFDALNNLRIPRQSLPGYAAGGLVTTTARAPRYASTGPSASTTRVVPVPVPVESTHTTTVHAPIHVDRVVSPDAGSFVQWGTGQRGQSGLGGQR